MQAARETYGVDPLAFIVIYLACAPVWYYSMFRSLRSVALKRMNELMLWSAIFLSATVAPFIYVILFGRNIPWWVYALIVVLVGQGLMSLAMKLRRPGGTAASN